VKWRMGCAGLSSRRTAEGAPTAELIGPLQSQCVPTGTDYARVRVGRKLVCRPCGPAVPSWCRLHGPSPRQGRAARPPQ